MIHSCVFLFSDSCSWVPCLSWTVKLSAVLQKNPSGPTNSLVFQHCCVLELIWVPQLSLEWKDGSQTHTVIVGKGSNTHTQTKCCKTKEFVGHEGFFWWTAGSLTLQDKQGTMLMRSNYHQTKKTAVDHSGNNTVLKLKGCKLLNW